MQKEQDWREPVLRPKSDRRLWESREDAEMSLGAMLFGGDILFHASYLQ
jgi:hypothetical protein